MAFVEKNLIVHLPLWMRGDGADALAYRKEPD